MLKQIIKIIKKFFIRTKSFLVTNWSIKFACLGLAAIMWIFVTSSQSLIGKYPGEIEITTSGLSSGYTAVFDQKTADITIMAEPSVWKDLTNDSFTATLDLSGLQEGTYEKDLKISCNNPDVKIIKSDPAQIIVRIEKILKKNLTINPKIDGSAAEGLVAGTIEIVPETVEVSGPSSVVNNLTEAVINIYLNKESSNFEKRLKIVALGEDNKPISGLTFTPVEALAKIAIVKASNNKTVGVQVKISGAPAEGYYVSDVLTTPQTVDITGSSAALSNLNYLETSYISVAGADASIEKTVNLTLPSGIALQSGSSREILVKLTISETPSSKTITATLNPINLPSNLLLDSITPTEVNVVVSGPVSQISSLTPADVVIDINLQNYSSGSNNFALSTSSVKVPKNVTVESLVISTLKIQLSDK